MNDISVNSYLPQICRHIVGGYELHFLLNQRPFFFRYTKFDLHRSLPSVHTFSPFLTEGLGDFPTRYFQPTRGRDKGENTEVGTHFLCLLRIFTSHLSTTPKSVILPNRQGKSTKKKRGKRKNRLLRFFHIHIIAAILAAFIAFPNAVKSYNGTCLFMTNALLTKQRSSLEKRNNICYNYHVVIVWLFQAYMHTKGGSYRCWFYRYS